MDHDLRLPDANEPMTEEEVRALVERFGERQGMAQGQPTVQDVAEALQVEPATVGRMLFELRRSKDQDEIRQRLDRLEKENAELRQRTESSVGYARPTVNGRNPRAAWVAMVAALAFVLLMPAVRASQTGGTPPTGLTVLPVILIFVLLLKLRHLRGR